MCIFQHPGSVPSLSELPVLEMGLLVCLFHRARETGVLLALALGGLSSLD